MSGRQRPRDHHRGRKESHDQRHAGYQRRREGEGEAAPGGHGRSADRNMEPERRGALHRKIFAEVPAGGAVPGGVPVVPGGVHPGGRGQEEGGKYLRGF